MINSSHIFNRHQLLSLLGMRARIDGRTPDDRLMVGMVGYPNVGKSSVINVLCGRKRVGVASMPGKTKHFQTLNLEGKGSWNICLCDCPGLVFPSFANSKAEMMCCGVLPIDMMKDFISPVSLIVHRVPKSVLETHYRIKLPAIDSKNYTASVFLQVFGAKKGLVTGRGLPNEAMAARYVLKDYVNGKLIFCHVRPDYDRSIHGDIQQSGFYTEMHMIQGEELMEAQERRESDVGVTAADEEEKKEGEDGEDESEDEDEVHELEEDQSHQPGASTTLSQATGTTSKYKAESAMEEDLDHEFFIMQQQTPILQTLKLNKGEKRALKFAVKKGVNLDEIPNLKAWLEEQVKIARIRKNVRNVSDAGAKSKKTDKYNRGGNNSNKFYAFTKFEDDGTGGNFSD